MIYSFLWKDSVGDILIAIEWWSDLMMVDVAKLARICGPNLLRG